MGDNIRTVHPAFSVSNINTFIPVILEMESSQYASWEKLLKIHARAFLSLDHIIPSANADIDSEDKSSVIDEALWSCTDSIVLQWIYGTISNDLLHTFVAPDSTVGEA